MTTLEPALAARFARLLPRLRHPVVAATLTAAVLHLIWAVFLANDAGDLAAQYAWTDFAIKHPDSAYNLSWYGGMHPASYSLISPYIMGWLGVRTTAVLAGTLSASLGALLLVRCGVRKPLVPALWLAFALWCDVASGRVTFALGMFFALLSAVLLFGGPVTRLPRLLAAAAAGAVATMCSPVAGLFIEILAAALFLVRRRRDAYILAAGPPLVIGVTSLLFPSYGIQPFTWYFAVLTAATAVAIAAVVPREWRIVRAASWTYAAGAVLSWVIPSPIGSNVERFALLFGGTAFLCAALAVPGARGWKTIVTYAGFAAVAIWTVAGPAADLINTAPVSATIAHAEPLIHELARIDADDGRVEVVPLRTHWEAAGVAPYVNLARGWNRQADLERNPIFYNGTLTAATYRAWLRDWGVGYVVLPAYEPDGSGVVEAKIIAAGTPWLKLVWRDDYWRVYHVVGAEPLAAPPAVVTYAGPAKITVRVPAAGSVLLRVTWSPWLAVDGVPAGGPVRGCLAQEGVWTRLYVPAPGTYTIEAPYGLTRGTPCVANGDAS